MQNKPCTQERLFSGQTACNLYRNDAEKPDVPTKGGYETWARRRLNDFLD